MAAQIITDCETSHWTSSNMDSVPLHSSSRLWDLISELNAKFTFIWKENFGPPSNSPVLFLLSPGKILLTMFLFQKWLGSPFLKMSERGDSWCTDSSFSSLLVKLSQVFESALLDSILKLAVILVACAHVPIHFFLPVNFAFNVLWYSTPWTPTPFSNDPLWLTLFVEGVFWNDRLLEVSSVPHYCGFKEQEIPRIYTIWMVIYWNSNVNILIF